MAEKQLSEIFVKENPVNSKLENWTILEEPSIKEIIYQVKCKCDCGAVRYVDLEKLTKNPPVKCLSCCNVGAKHKPDPKIIIEDEIIKIPLQGKYNHLFMICDLSDLELVKDKKWYCKPGIHSNYAKTVINREFWYIHQVLVGNKDILLDHIDNDGLNNRRSNLRKCNEPQNMRNKSKSRGKTSDYYGVSFLKKSGLWRSSLFLDYKQIHCKSFKTEIEAAIDHDLVAKKYHGEFAKLNFPELKVDHSE